MHNFGRRVRALRLASGLSQADLGRLALVGDRFVGLIERGKGNPSLVTMALIAEALESDLGEMLSQDASSSYVTLKADDATRAREAIAVLRAVFPEHRPRKRAR
jgi:transcriptional regulator with XRE-family HTH domain